MEPEEIISEAALRVWKQQEQSRRHTTATAQYYANTDPLNHNWDDKRVRQNDFSSYPPLMVGTM